MRDDRTLLSLSECDGGRLEEEFQLALTDVLADFRDHQKSEKEVRKITIEFDLKGMSGGADLIGSTYRVRTKLARAPAGQIFLQPTERQGELLPFELPKGDGKADPRQRNLAPVSDHPTKTKDKES